MTRRKVSCEGRGYPGCDSCINRELDPFQCVDCNDESNWEGDAGDFNDDTSQDYSLEEFSDLVNGSHE